MPVPTKPKTKKRPKPLTPEEKEVLAEVGKLFTACAKAPKLPPIPGGKGGRYELYLYLMVAEWLLHQKGSNLRVVNPGAGKEFRFKGRPSHASNEYSYCTCTSASGQKYDLRNGVEYQGHNMRHEVDIALSASLQHKQVPTEQELCLAVECKYFAGPNGFKGQFRSQVGAILDLTAGHHAGAGCIWFGTSFHAYFASHHPFSTRRDFSRYLLSYSITPLFDFHPGNKSLTRDWVRDCYGQLA